MQAIGRQPRRAPNAFEGTYGDSLLGKVGDCFPTCGGRSSRGRTSARRPAAPVSRQARLTPRAARRALTVTSASPASISAYASGSGTAETAVMSLPTPAVMGSGSHPGW